MAYHCLGCRICRKPLEPLNQPIHKLSSQRKPHKPSSKPPDKPEHLNPEPVATKCGHIFHKGCIKKMISEQASCRIACPACNRPVVLAQLRIVRFFYPTKCETLSRKIDKMNLENEVLAQQLDEVRKLRQRRKYEQDVVSGKIQELNNKVRVKQESLAEKQKKIKNMEFNGQSIEEIQDSLVTLKDRISVMSRNNAELLRHLESIMASMNDPGKLEENMSMLQELKVFFAMESVEDVPDRSNKVEGNNKQLQSRPNILKDENDPLSSLMNELVGNRQKISSAIDIVQDYCNNASNHNSTLASFPESTHAEPGDNPHNHNQRLVNSELPIQPMPSMAGDEFHGCLLTNNLHNYQFHRNQAQFLNWVDTSLLQQNLNLMHGQPFMNYPDWRFTGQQTQQPWVNSQLIKCTPETRFSLNTESNVSFGKVVMLPPGVPSQNYPTGMAEFVLDVTRKKQRKSDNPSKRHISKLGKKVKKGFKNMKRYSSTSLELNHYK